jgi:hypothetical protein
LAGKLVGTVSQLDPYVAIPPISTFSRKIPPEHLVQRLELIVIDRNGSVQASLLVRPIGAQVVLVSLGIGNERVHSVA